MARFEVVSRYKDKDLRLPARGTAYSAGYDLAVAENFIVPSHLKQLTEWGTSANNCDNILMTLANMRDMVTNRGIKPTLVPLGVKCYLAEDEYLKVVLRSSTPLKYWLVMANAEGIIDSDYTNAKNEGEIFLQLINLSPYNISLQKGDVIAQGIIQKYIKTADDAAFAALTAREGGFGSTGV